MRETVQGVKRVGPRRSNKSPLPALGCMPLTLHGDCLNWRLSCISRSAIAIATPRSASGGPSRTPRPTGCLLHGASVSEFRGYLRGCRDDERGVSQQYCPVVTCLLPGGVVAFFCKREKVAVLNLWRPRAESRSRVPPDPS